jgi:TolA-binding protein
MSDDELVEELLDAERDIDALAKDQRARLLARLGPLVIPGAIGAGAGAAAVVTGGSAEAAATGKAAGVFGAGLKAKLVVAAIAGAVGAVGGAVTQSALTSAPATKPAPTTPSSAGLAPPPLAQAVSATPASEATASATTSATPAPSTSAPARAGGATMANLRTERLLLERATSALMRGDASSALSALREHARKFPSGELAEEREGLLVRALRAAGQTDAAEKRAKDFKRQFPSSLQQGIIDAGPSNE